MKVHKVKIRPEYYEPVISGKKTFEVRYNDRDYQVGDALLLREWDESGYSGRESLFDITYMLKDYDAIKEGYVILSIMPREDRVMMDSGEQTEYAVVIHLVQPFLFRRGTTSSKSIEKLVIPCDDEEGMVDLHRELLKRLRECFENRIPMMYIEQLDRHIEVSDIRMVNISINGRIIQHRVLPEVGGVEYYW